MTKRSFYPLICIIMLSLGYTSTTKPFPVLLTAGLTILAGDLIKETAKPITREVAQKIRAWGSLVFAKLGLGKTDQHNAKLAQPAAASEPGSVPAQPTPTI